MLLDSSWTDITAESKNFFSIVGDSNYARRFFIERNYGGCASDNGWVVADSGNDPCSWETASDDIRILYASGNTYCNWQNDTNSGSIGFADIMAIFVR